MKIRFQDFVIWKAVRGNFRLVLLAFGLVMALVSSVNSVQYTFTEIAREEYPIGARGTGSINNSGVVAFLFMPDGTFADLYRYENGSVTMLYEGLSFTGLYASFETENPPINTSGVIAFEASLNSVVGGKGLFKGDGGAVTTIALDMYEDPNSILRSFDGELDMNNAGMVTFWAQHKDTFVQNIYTGDGGALNLIANTDSTVTEEGDTIYSISYSPAINTEETVAFVGQLNPQFPFNGGIFIGDGVTVKTLYDSTGQFNYLLAPLDINDAGTVAFKASLDTGPYGIFTGNGGTPTTVVDTSGPFLNYGDVAINNLGQIAFEGKLDAAPTVNGIYIGPDPVADKIIAEGDSFMGGVVKSLYFFRGFNDNGQITFRAVVDYNGTWIDGLYLANPPTCGDENNGYAPGDWSEDCIVNLFDQVILANGWMTSYGIAELAELASHWLVCNDPKGCPF